MGRVGRRRRSGCAASRRRYAGGSIGRSVGKSVCVCIHIHIHVVKLTTHTYIYPLPPMPTPTKEKLRKMRRGSGGGGGGATGPSIRRFPAPQPTPLYIPKPLSGGDVVNSVRTPRRAPKKGALGANSASNNMGAHDREVLERLRRRRRVFLGGIGDREKGGLCTLWLCGDWSLTCHPSLS